MPVTTSKKSTSDHSYGFSYKPVFDKIISLDLTKTIFYEYCKSQFVEESLDCLINVSKFLSFLREPERKNGDFEKFIKQLDFIVKNFILEDAPKQTNIDAFVKSEISTLYKLNSNTLHYNNNNNNNRNSNSSNNSNNSNNNHNIIIPNVTEWIKLFKSVEFQLLLLLKTDVFPRFVRDQKWINFVNENKERAKEWADEEDLNVLEEIKYKRKHFEYSFFSDHDLRFIDWVTEDQSCFQLVNKDANANLSIYLSSGKEFVDEKDVNFGSYGCLKVVGYLPFPAELMVHTFTCPRFNRLLHENMIIESSSFLTEDMNYKVLENGVKQYPYRVGRGHFKYGLLGLRSIISVASTFFYKGKYCCLVRGSLDEKYDHNYYVGDKKVKNTTRMCTISICCFAPISPTKCHFIQTTLVNPGGLLAKVSGMLTKKMASDWGKDISNKIKVMKIMIEEDLDGMEEHYFKTVENIIAFSKATGEKYNEDAFPKSFEEYRVKYRYLKDYLPKVEELLEQMESTTNGKKK
ncbi:hypothetical protein ABK040_011490 [Willaertia magna]